MDRGAWGDYMVAVFRGLGRACSSRYTLRAEPPLPKMSCGADRFF